MNLTALEQQYHALRRDLGAGQIDEATFISAVDQLGFQDQWGRYWLMGVESGGWYYYDGQTGRWQPGDPHRADPLLGNIQRHSHRRATSATSMLVSGFVCLMLLALLVWPVGGASPANGFMQSPPPTPTFATLLDTNPAGSNSTISGLVTDLSSGQPGANIGVAIGEAIVHTDPEGRYSLPGLSAGSYVVSPELQDQQTPAQGPVFVNVDGQNSVTVDLAYYSQAQPLPTDTPQASVVAAPVPTSVPAATPPALPTAGAPLNSQPLVIAGLGLLLIGGGMLLKKL